MILGNLNCIFTGYDVCSFFDTHSNFAEEPKETQLFLDLMGIEQQIKSPKHKDFAAPEVRLKSCEICTQPFIIDPLIRGINNLKLDFIIRVNV